MGGDGPGGAPTADKLEAAQHDLDQAYDAADEHELALTRATRKNTASWQATKVRETTSRMSKTQNGFRRRAHSKRE